MTERDDDRARIRAVIKTINDAWLAGEPDSLQATMAHCFHEKAVVRGPGFSEMGRGIDAIVAGYQEFLKSATIRECELAEPEIDLAGDTAIATYAWKLVYHREGKRHEDSGHDVFVLARHEGAWLVRWRAMVVS